jgi:hypothetical protein
MVLQNHQTVLTRQSFHKASCKVNPSVTGYIFLSQWHYSQYLRLLKLTPQNSLAFSATVAESEMRPGISNPFLLLKLQHFSFRV